MNQSQAWICKNCQTTDINLKYSSGNMPVCKDCQKYRNIKINANVKRKKIKNPELLISEQEFIDWIRNKEKKCYYCNVTEDKLKKLKIKSQIGLNIESLGIDRMDSNGDYTISNIVLCCFVCNKVKSNFFSQDEMKHIGEHIHHIWNQRLEV